MPASLLGHDVQRTACLGSGGPGSVVLCWLATRHTAQAGVLRAGQDYLWRLAVNRRRLMADGGWRPTGGLLVV